MDSVNLKIYQGKVLSLTQCIQQLAELGYTQVGTLREEGDFRSKGENLDIFCVGYQWPVRIQWEYDTVQRIRSYDLASYTFFGDHQFLIVLPKTYSRRPHHALPVIPLQTTLDIHPGDYLVHLNYGIGKYVAQKTLAVKGKQKHFFEIHYKNNEKLFVPFEQAHLIQKYVNLGRKNPKVSRLGSKKWTTTTKRIQRLIHTYALELVRQEALRRVMGGVAYSKDTLWQKEFDGSFAYRLTPDQERAWSDTRKDMEQDQAMDRLVCGDVGYGKTEVAMRAAFKAAVNSKQVAFLVPTTILAEQHYQTFQQRLANFPLKVQMLSRFRSLSQQKAILEDVRKGIIDILIGTHRLLSGDVRFKSLGLLIIDEEQRFGVAQKESIKRFKVGVDVLTLSATPIPRTLYMSLTGLKSVSIIKTAPLQRQAVKTAVEHFNPLRIKDAITAETSRGGQVYFIENRIKNLPRIRKLFGTLLPKSIRTEVAYGRMSAQSLERIMIDFINHKIDCLISTAIIESGIDIPLANTLMVNNAHMFGLADLHQLRGRVGRFNRQAYAYFFVPKGKLLSTAAAQRLDSLKRYAYLGAGFDLSMQDLELRGAGNLLGQQQHGFIWQIGLDLYCRLLRGEIELLSREFKLNN